MQVSEGADQPVCITDSWSDGSDNFSRKVTLQVRELQILVNVVVRCLIRNDAFMMSPDCTRRITMARMWCFHCCPELPAKT